MLKQLSVVIFVVSFTTFNMMVECLEKERINKSEPIVTQMINLHNMSNEMFSSLKFLSSSPTYTSLPELQKVISSTAKTSVKQLFSDNFNQHLPHVNVTRKIKEIKNSQVKKNLLSIDRLILNDFIFNHKWREGRRLSMVTQLPRLQDGSILYSSYSAWITVEKQLNVFFWYFPSRVSTAPLIISLEGSSQESSLFQVFNGNGPYEITPQLTVINRNNTWIDFASILYIDLPLIDAQGVTITSNQSAKHLYTMLDKFFPFFPNSFLGGIYFMSTDESIRIIMQSIRIFEETFSLYQSKIKGVIAINPIISPAFQFTYFSKYLFNNGLIDSSQYLSIRSDISKLRKLMKNNNYKKAYQMFQQLLGTSSIRANKFQQFTGYTNDDNLLEPFTSIKDSLYKIYLQQSHVRLALHGYQSVSFDSSDESKVIDDSLDYRDVMLDIGHIVRDHLSRYQLLSLTGNLNIALPCQSIVGVVNKSLSNCPDNFNTSSKLYLHSPELDGPKIHGHVYNACNATVIIVLNAGNQIITDQALFVYHSVKTFLSLHSHDVYS